MSSPRSKVNTPGSKNTTDTPSPRRSKTKMFHMQLSKLVGIAQAAKKDGSLAAGKPSAKTMSMMERCEKPALWYRMERLKRHGLALAAVQQDGMALKLQNKLIRRDRGIVLAAVKQNGMALQFADPDNQEKLNRDREIVMTAVGSNGLALEFVDYSLRRDRDVVLLAVRSHGGALEFASAKLKRDKIICLYACREHIDALQFAAVGTPRTTRRSSTGRCARTSASCGSWTRRRARRCGKNGMNTSRTKARGPPRGTNRTRFKKSTWSTGRASSTTACATRAKRGIPVPSRETREASSAASKPGSTGSVCPAQTVDTDRARDGADGGRGAPPPRREARVASPERHLRFLRDGDFVRDGVIDTPVDIAARSGVRIVGRASSPPTVSTRDRLPTPTAAVAAATERASVRFRRADSRPVAAPDLPVIEPAATPIERRAVETPPTSGVFGGLGASVEGSVRPSRPDAPARASPL